MPLYPDAIQKIKENLECIRDGKKAKTISIGTLSAQQLEVINNERESRTPPLPPMTKEVVFIGGHIYQRRITDDRYTIEDVIQQIQSAMSSESVVIVSTKMTAMQAITERPDHYGNMVIDRIVFECTNKHPSPELFSVIPKNDKNKPPRG